MSVTQTVHTGTAQLLPLAQELDEEKVTPGVLGFIVFAVIGLAVWLLMKSMYRHMNKVDFQEPAEESRASRSARPSENTT